MRKLICVLFLSALAFGQGIGGNAGIGGKAGIGGGPPGAPIVVQAPTNGCAAGAATCTITFGSPITAGNRILVFTLSNGGAVVPTMTGETFVRQNGTASCSYGTSGDGFDCYLVASATGGQTALACNTGGTNLTCFALEISHPVGNTPQDAAGNSQATCTTGCTVSTSAATTNTPDLFIAAFGESQTYGTTITATTGTVVGNAVYNGGSSYLLVTKATTASNATQTATATASNSVAVSAGAIAIKP